MKMSVLGLVFVMSATSASAANDEGFGRGMGSQTCEAFTRERAEEPDSEALFYEWAEGYMTGSNVTILATGRSAYRDLSGDSSDQMSRIRAFCETHPSSRFVDAVMDVYTHLPIAQVPSH